MIPVIAIVGRPNVGKSTLFNVLTRTRDALVYDQPGVTRDRHYGKANVEGRDYWLVDTGGFLKSDDAIDRSTNQQVLQAIEDADHILFMVDARVGVQVADEEMAQLLREHADKVTVVANKTDNQDIKMLATEFYSLGLGDVFDISAKRRSGLDGLTQRLLEVVPESEPEEDLYQDAIHIAVLGRPNVGKSTLINRILGEERVMVMDHPGTTRDSIQVPFTRRDQDYVLIDTAGIRRRTKVHDTVEKFSVLKALQAIERAQVVILLLDASEGVTDQDLRILHAAVEEGCAILIVFNKIDHLDDDQKLKMERDIDLQLRFIDYVKPQFISALHGTGVGELFPIIRKAYALATTDANTAKLTELLQKAVQQHQPPLVGNRRIKLRYAHLGGHFPWRLVIHGKQVNKLPQSYQRYLVGYFRKAFKLQNVPIRLRLKPDDNPYAK